VRAIIPTAVNLTTALAAELVRQRRAGVQLLVELPPLRQRAWMVVNVTGLLPIVVDPTASATE
jgi:hypothetical protein